MDYTKDFHNKALELLHGAGIIIISPTISPPDQEFQRFYIIKDNGVIKTLGYLDILAEVVRLEEEEFQFKHELGI